MSSFVLNILGMPFVCVFTLFFFVVMPRPWVCSSEFTLLSCLKARFWLRCISSNLTRGSQTYVGAPAKVACVGDGRGARVAVWYRAGWLTTTGGGHRVMGGGDRIVGLLQCICLFAMNVALVLACPRFQHVRMVAQM